MKVYIVQTCEYDDTSIHGVYATRELAEAAKTRLDSRSRERAIAAAGRYQQRTRKLEVTDEMIEEWRDHYMVTEYEVLTETEPAQHAARHGRRVARGEHYRALPREEASE